MTDVLLVAHGSRHPQARETVEKIAAAVRRRLSGRTVSTCALDIEAPTPRAALLSHFRHGVRQVRVVPLLFAPGHHIQVDLPSQIAAATVAAGWTPTADEQAFATIAPPLIDLDDRRSVHWLLDALDARAGAIRGSDALVLMAAGSSDEDARATVTALAQSWGDRHGVPALPAFASGPGPAPAGAVESARASGAGRVVAGSLFVAPGLLAVRAERAATSAGAHVAPVLGAQSALVELIVRRATTGTRSSVAAVPFPTVGSFQPSSVGDQSRLTAWSV